MSAKEVITPIVDLAKASSSSSADAVVAGFAFASAVSWMDFVRFAISKLVKVQKNGAEYYLLTALATTILATAIYMVAKKLRKDTKAPSVVYAVSS